MCNVACLTTLRNVIHRLQRRQSSSDSTSEEVVAGCVPEEEEEEEEEDEDEDEDEEEAATFATFAAAFWLILCFPTASTTATASTWHARALRFPGGLPRCRHKRALERR